MNVRSWVRQYLPLATVLLVLYLVYRYLLPLVLPFAVAAAIAVLMDPLVALLQRRLRLPRGLAVGVTLLGLVSLVLLFLFAGVTRLAAEARLLFDDVPFAYARMEANVEELLGRWGQWLGSLPPAVRDLLEQQRAAVLLTARSWLGRTASGLQAWVTALPDLVVHVLVVAIATFFISRDKAWVRNFLLSMVPRPWRDPVAGMARQLVQSFVGFTVAMFLLVVLTAVVTSVGLAVLGSRYALLLGGLAGVLDVLPVLGPSLLFVPWGLYHVVFGEFIFGVGLLVLWGVVTAARTVLQAQVIGERIGLHPLVTLISLYAGAQLLGPSGFILGPLTAVLLKAMVDAGLLTWDGDR